MGETGLMKNHLFFAVLPFLFSCGSETANDLIEEVGNPDAGCQSVATIMQEMTQFINEARGLARQCGEYGSFQETGVILWNEQLYQAADSHSQDMSSNNFFDHTGSDGLNVDMRILAAGYTAIAWGENISAGHNNSRDVVNSWLNSPGHCANIMTPAFTEIGSACAGNISADYGTYWTLVFAAPG